MEQEYWNRFTQTGRVEDYLYYKGMAICRQVMKRREQEGDIRNESDYSDRDGTYIGSCR